MPAERVDLIWVAADDDSTEHFVLERRDGVTTLSGTVILVSEGQPTTITYRVAVDGAWRTTAIEATVSAAEETRIALQVVDGAWSADGAPRSRLDGCLDIDLGWTPATNLLPIRRLGLEVGEIGRIDAAWLRWPELDVVSVAQTYERVDENDYVYRAGEHELTLHTTADGIVTSYGDGLWVATSILRS